MLDHQIEKWVINFSGSNRQAEDQINSFLESKILLDSEGVPVKAHCLPKKKKKYRDFLICKLEILLLETAVLHPKA
jgi:hypothetical protein